MTVMPGDPGDVQKSLARLKFLGRGKKREILKHAQRIQKYIAETESRKLKRPNQIFFIEESQRSWLIDHCRKSPDP